MSLVTPQNLFALSMLLVAATLAYLPLLLVMHILMPREVVDRYWKWPYFGAIEIGLCSAGIWRPLRTQKLIATMVFPIIARKRGLKELIVPRWYRIAARMLIAWGIAASAGFMSILAGLYAYAVTNGQAPVPVLTRLSLTDGLMLACLVFCVMYFVVRHWWPRHGWPLKKRVEE